MGDHNIKLHEFSKTNKRWSQTTPRHVHYGQPQDQEDVLASLPSQNIGASSLNTLHRPRKNLKINEFYETIPILKHYNSAVSNLDYHADYIVGELEKDETLMENNPFSEQLRIETLREMPESLTLKRTVKKKLVRSVSQKSKQRTVGFFKRIRYKFSIMASKFITALKDILYSLELWYSSLKVIEGHFGSGVATYFKFFRWLFLLNVFLFITNLAFLAIPQLLYYGNQQNSGENTTATASSLKSIAATLLADLKLPSNKTSSSAYAVSGNVRSDATYFSFADVFVGEGSFTDTSLYYGYYSNTSFSVISNLEYNMPMAYFFTTLCCFIVAFLTVSISMAQSYRRVFIEASGGMKNLYAHKIFCGWDFSIATPAAADLKYRSIYNEIKELLAEDYKISKNYNQLAHFKLFLLRCMVNFFAIALLTGIAIGMWLMLSKQAIGWTYALPLIVTFIMVVAPLLFSSLVRFEEYESPRTALYITLLRVFGLELVVTIVIVVYWFQQATVQSCWETSLGQEIYRLIVLDFFVGTIGISLAELIRKKIYSHLWVNIGAPEFDIARNTLNLIYNETLLFVGFFYSPLLPLVVVIKMFITFYIKKIGALYSCQPASNSWRASQTQTVFLMLTFFSLLAAIIGFGYVLSYGTPSVECGPFRENISKLIMDTVFNLEEGHTFWKVIFFFTKPGVVAGILIGMIFWAYYIHSKATACAEMIDLLKEMLAVEAEDKEFLLANIAKVTEGKWKNEVQPRNKIKSQPAVYMEKQTIRKEQLQRQPSSNNRAPPYEETVRQPHNQGQVKRLRRYE